VHIFTDYVDGEVLGKDANEDEMLRRVIAMSLDLEIDEKESFSIKGEFLNEMSIQQQENGFLHELSTFQMKRWLPTFPPQATMTRRRRRC